MSVISETAAVAIMFWNYLIFHLFCHSVKGSVIIGKKVVYRCCVPSDWNGIQTHNHLVRQVWRND